MKMTFNKPHYGAVVLLALGSACTSTDTDEKSEGETAATSSSSGSAVDASTADAACGAASQDACGTCMQTACCDALVECERDEDCMACVTATDSDACEKTPATHARVDAYLTCRGGEACAPTCVSATGGACTALLDDLVDPTCQTCMEDNCCDEVASCHGNAVCWDGCFTNHNESKCHADPDAHSLFHAMGACSTKSCAAECN
jgi:hypothetical protein